MHLTYNCHITKNFCTFYFLWSYIFTQKKLLEYSNKKKWNASKISSLRLEDFKKCFKYRLFVFKSIKWRVKGVAGIILVYVGLKISLAINLLQSPWNNNLLNIRNNWVNNLVQSQNDHKNLIWKTIFFFFFFLK